MTMDLEKYVTSMSSKGLVRTKKSDYATLCPVCYERHRMSGDSSYHKLKLWIDKSYDFGHCFRCGTVFLTENQSINTGLKRVESPVNMSNWELCKLGEEGFWTLSKFDTFDEDDKDGVDYLAHRVYLYRQMYKYLHIKFKDSNPVVPFYFNGQLIYYQVRIIDPNSKIKYFSPSIDHKPPYIIENKDNKKFVICEGTFDAIACRILFPDRTPFAVLGSDITQYQIAMLRSYCPEDILIYMDKTELSYGIKETIEKYINYADISIQESDGQDPEEYLKETLITKSYEQY